MSWINQSLLNSDLLKSRLKDIKDTKSYVVWIWRWRMQSGLWFFFKLLSFKAWRSQKPFYLFLEAMFKMKHGFIFRFPHRKFHLFAIVYLKYWLKSSMFQYPAVKCYGCVSETLIGLCCIAQHIERLNIYTYLFLLTIKVPRNLAKSPHYENSLWTFFLEIDNINSSLWIYFWFVASSDSLQKL